MPLSDERVNVYLPSSVGSKRARLLFFITLVSLPPGMMPGLWKCLLNEYTVNSGLGAGETDAKSLGKDFSFVLFCFNWSIVDLECCVNFCCAAK